MSAKNRVKLPAVSNLELAQNASGVSVFWTETPFQSIAGVIRGE